MGKGHNPRWAGPQGHRLQECLPLDSWGGFAPRTVWRKTKTAPKSPISNVEKSHSGSAYEKIVIIEFGFYNNITTVERKKEKEEVLEECKCQKTTAPLNALSSLGWHLTPHNTSFGSEPHAVSTVSWSRGRQGWRISPPHSYMQQFPPPLPRHPISGLSTRQVAECAHKQQTSAHSYC